MFGPQKKTEWTPEEKTALDNLQAELINALGLKQAAFGQVEPDVWIECNERPSVPEGRPDLKEGSVEIFHPVRGGSNITLRRRIESGVMIWEYLM